MTHRFSHLTLIQLIPNFLTVLAICAGMTAIRFAYEGNFETAVRLILVACVLDALDGRIARLLNQESPLGAELDSLADFLNFGVAPGLIIHTWALQDFRSAGWIAVLGYGICGVMRLARFNVDLEQDDMQPSNFFDGLPSPAAAVIVMLPLYVSFLFLDLPQAPDLLVAGYVLAIGLLMISPLRICSFKQLTFTREHSKLILLALALTIAALMTFLWATLILLIAVYIASLIWAARTPQ